MRFTLRRLQCFSRDSSRPATRHSTGSTLRLVLACALLLGALSVPFLQLSAWAGGPRAALSEFFKDVPARSAPSGVLYDRVLPLSRLGELDGTASAPVSSLARWQQAYHEIRQAASEKQGLPSLNEIRARVARRHDQTIRIALLDYRYDRLRESALQDGSARISGGRIHLDSRALRQSRVFAATALREKSYEGYRLRFELSRESIFSNLNAPNTRYYLDTGDGTGLHELNLDLALNAHYAAPGTKVLRLRAVAADGAVHESAFQFEVAALATPAPDDTLQLTAGISYQGVAATGEAYLYYAPGHDHLVEPLVFIEGFDLDNSLYWDELYGLLNAENMVEDIRSAGYDIVVLNFDDATDYLQRNSYLVVELLQEVQQSIDPLAHFTLAGASMGGLCGRYALTYMEHNGLTHRVSTFISFDAPQRGANIPLGLQYWLDFFSGDSADAEFLLSRLDRPAARQMLVYHHSTPPSSTASQDTLRTAFTAELAALGDYPSEPRLVAIANGSGTQQNQGFAPAAQIMQWEYSSFLVDITGNVWAVSDGASQRIFQGKVNIILLPSDTEDVTVSGTDPYDNAPGGSRASMAQADSTEAPYGDIVALYPSHCFIPTISSLDLATNDLFFDEAGASDLAGMSPFDAVYFPVENQEHVMVTSENAAWIKSEIFSTPTATQPVSRPGPLAVLYPNAPNPFNPATVLRFDLSQASRVQLQIFDLRGRKVRTLVDETLPAGQYSRRWDGRDDAHTGVASGVYIGSLSAGGKSQAQRMTLVR